MSDNAEYDEFLRLQRKYDPTPHMKLSPWDISSLSDVMYIESNDGISADDILRQLDDSVVTINDVPHYRECDIKTIIQFYATRLIRSGKRCEVYADQRDRVIKKYNPRGCSSRKRYMYQ